MSKKKVVALLPMKANSERVKGKNFKEFCGKPLFRWVLDSLLETAEIDEIIINTDARHILSANGLVSTDRVIVRDRNANICGDFVSMNKIIADDIENVPADIYMMTHTTNPFLSAATLRSSIAAYEAGLKDGSADSLFTVDKFQTRFYKSDGSPINHDPNNLIRTQDLEPWYEENSNLYIFSKESFSATNARIGVKPILFEGPRLESVDIDDQNDWEFAEITANYLRAAKEKNNG